MCKNSDLISCKLHYSFSNLLRTIFHRCNSPFYHHKWSNPTLTDQFLKTALCPQIDTIQINFIFNFLRTRITNCCANSCMEEFAVLNTVLCFVYTFYSEDTAKRRTQKSKSFKEVEKFDVFVLEKSSGCKFRSLQLLLFAIMSAAFLTLLYTPSVYEHQLQSSSRLVHLRMNHTIVQYCVKGIMTPPPPPKKGSWCVSYGWSLVVVCITTLSILQWCLHWCDGLQTCQWVDMG